MSNVFPTSAPKADPARAAETNLPRILAITCAVNLLALGFVVARVYTRAFLKKSFGHDDTVMVTAMLCAVGGMVCNIIMGKYGLGRHIDSISISDMIMFNKVAFVQSVMSAITGLGLLKISIALMLLRLSSDTNPWFARSLWALIAFTCAYTFMAWMTFFLQCQPLYGVWDRTLQPPPNCYSVQMLINFGIVNTACNIFTDVCFATLPIPIIWRLQMKNRTRIYLCVVLSLGYFAVILGVLKAIYQMALGTDNDRTFNQWLQFWGFLQLNVGIIAACAPTLRPLVGGLLRLHSHPRSRESEGSADSSSKSNKYYTDDLSRKLGSNNPLQNGLAYSQHMENGTASHEMRDRQPQTTYHAAAECTTPNEGPNRLRKSMSGVFGHTSRPSDVGSDEGILGLERETSAQPGGGILLTTEFSVDNTQVNDNRAGTSFLDTQSTESSRLR